jgi:hypothetical protein
MMKKCVSHVCDGLSPVVALATLRRGTGNSKGDLYRTPNEAAPTLRALLTLVTHQYL